MRRRGESIIKLCRKTTSSGVRVTDSNVIPFRKRPPSESELEVYRQITRYWSPAVRQMMFPEHFKHDQEREEGAEERAP